MIPRGKVNLTSGPWYIVTMRLRDKIDSHLKTDADLDAFCIDHFPHIHQRFSSGMERTQKVNLLLQLASENEIARFLEYKSDKQYRSKCPLPGLEPFDQNQANLFFGRKAEVTEAVRLMGQVSESHRRWLIVEGSSGVGKSSFAHAGLIPAAQRGEIRGAPEGWLVATMRPGRDPIRNLSYAVSNALGLDADDTYSNFQSSSTSLSNTLNSRLPARHGLLLTIDQFEEIFTVSESSEKFDTIISETLSNLEIPCYLITVIRSDFVSATFSKLPKLESVINQASRYYLRAIQTTELMTILENLSLKVGFTWELGLLDRIFQDIAFTEGYLPLIGHVLRSLWDNSADQKFTHQIYENLGGIAGSVNHVADDLLNSLDSIDRRNAQFLLLRLVRIGRGTPDAQRSITRAEAVEAAGGGERAERILARLSGGRSPNAPAAAPAPPRIIVVSSIGSDSSLHQVDLVHSSLLQHWKTLHRWIEADRKLLIMLDDLETAAKVWEATGSPEDGLPGGTLLSYYDGIGLPHEQRQRFFQLMSTLSTHFLAASKKSNADHLDRKEAQRKWNIVMISITTTLMGLLPCIGIILSEKNNIKIMRQQKEVAQEEAGFFKSHVEQVEERAAKEQREAVASAIADYEDKIEKTLNPYDCLCYPWVCQTMKKVQTETNTSGCIEIKHKPQATVP